VLLQKYFPFVALRH